MNLSEIFENRRSIRRYDNTPIDEETLSEILKIGLLSPTGNNLKTVDFIFIMQEYHDLFRSWLNCIVVCTIFF